MIARANSGLNSLMLPTGAAFARLTVSVSGAFLGSEDTYRVPFIFGALLPLLSVVLHRVKPERALSH